MYDRINSGVNALIEQEGYAYTLGFMQAQLQLVLQYVPKTKQKMLLEDFERAVGSKVKVKVKNLLSGIEVEIPWNERGGPCDPSTERYHSM